MLVEEVDSNDPEEEDLRSLHTLPLQTVADEVEGEAKKIKKSTNVFEIR